VCGVGVWGGCGLLGSMGGGWGVFDAGCLVVVVFFRHRHKRAAIIMGRAKRKVGLIPMTVRRRRREAAWLRVKL